MSPLTWSDGLALAAQDHCADSALRGTLSHEGGDGTRVKERVLRYGTVVGEISENLSFGKSGRPDEYVTGLFVDDGVEDRQHRYTMLNPMFNLVGVAYCAH